MFGLSPVDFASYQLRDQATKPAGVAINATRSGRDQGDSEAAARHAEPKESAKGCSATRRHPCRGGVPRAANQSRRCRGWRFDAECAIIAQSLGGRRCPQTQRPAVSRVGDVSSWNDRTTSLQDATDCTHAHAHTKMQGTCTGACPRAASIRTHIAPTRRVSGGTVRGGSDRGPDAGVHMMPRHGSTALTLQRRAGRGAELDLAKGVCAAGVHGKGFGSSQRGKRKRTLPPSKRATQRAATRRAAVTPLVLVVHTAPRAGYVGLRLRALAHVEAPHAAPHPRCRSWRSILCFVARACRDAHGTGRGANHSRLSSGVPSQSTQTKRLSSSGTKAGSCRCPRRAPSRSPPRPSSRRASRGRNGRKVPALRAMLGHDQLMVHWRCCRAACLDTPTSSRRGKHRKWRSMH